MVIKIVGIGMGDTSTMTAQAAQAILDADVLIGAQRMLESAQAARSAAGKDIATELKAISPNAIVSAIESIGDVGCFAILCSGDTGFYSLATSVIRTINERLPRADIELIPGITTVQYFASRLAKPWQSVALASAHGKTCNVLDMVLSHEQVFLLTGGELTPQTIINELAGCGLGFCEVAVGERLSYEDERITTGTAAELVGHGFDSLSAIWISRGQLCDDEVAAYAGFPGIPDDAFIRGTVPMTKRDIRALCTSKMRVANDEVVWDIGAGTGSVSIEAACMQPSARVYAIECKEEGCTLIEQNRVRFGAYNITVVRGRAPEALNGLPAPDVAFIGGSTGGLAQIVDTVLAANRKARIVISAITLETVAQTQALLANLAEHGIIDGYQATQISVATSREAGRYHLMTAENPIFVFEAHGIAAQETDK
ncbi:MAG: precorrin-6y C5,15-methyltransferase (decarboxylating) subunit CbiE [Eggerthellaceae bacterium]|nr:precorrin-6y C5,15-methyltransferase (decarboxylating) subunit CbiE [Eggerthellaceae bacterium]